MHKAGECFKARLCAHIHTGVHVYIDLNMPTLVSVHNPLAYYVCILGTYSIKVHAFTLTLFTVTQLYVFIHVCLYTLIYNSVNIYVYTHGHVRLCTHMKMHRGSHSSKCQSSCTSLLGSGHFSVT